MKITPHWSRHVEPLVATMSNLLPWLEETGSFMLRLKRFGIHEASIQILNQRWEFPSYDECQCLNILPRQYALIREVMIKSGEHAWMFARTVFPQAMLTGKERRFAYLRTRALGTLLFNNPTISRYPFEFSVLTPETDWFKKIKKETNISTSTLLARRSLFHIKHKQLLLAEVFLPALLDIR